MSEKELREVLRAIVDPAMFDGNYVRSDWLPRWREAHDHARRLLDIPVEPERADKVGVLDLDALERAYVRVLDRTPWAEVRFSANGALETQRRMFLERIAAEYARLDPAHDAPSVSS